MEFHALHISDIHFDDESTSNREYRQEIANKITTDGLNADCLIISGDLFNRGSLDGSQFEAYSRFIKRLPGHECILAVPGNHDLDRSAQSAKEGSFNVYTTRRKLVNDKARIVKETGREFKITNDEKTLLYQMSFGAFRSFSRKMGFQSFCGDDSELSVDNYEVQDIDVPYSAGSSYNVRFVLLNTALIAGQSLQGKPYRERLAKLEVDYHQALADGDSLRATEINVEIAKQRKRYDEAGELIVDEETEGESGRLSLSMEGNAKLNDLKPNGALLTIFVGHHGFQYLAKETQTALKNAMKKCQSGIYLCGHAHKARFRRFPIQQNSFPRDVEQVQAGVMFKDDTSYSQYGFDYISFSLEKSKLTISSYFLVKAASEEPRWLREDFEYIYNLPGNNSPRIEQGNTVEPNTIDNTIDEPLPGQEEDVPHRLGPASTHYIRLSNYIDNGEQDN